MKHEMTWTELAVVVALIAVGMVFLSANWKRRFQKCMAEKHDEILCDIYSRAR